MTPRPLPEQDYLQDCFDYDPATGVLTWKHRADASARWNTIFAGKTAGSVKSNGSRKIQRRQVKINGQPYFASRVIWKLMTGKDPAATIDHANGDPLDNRWDNLREATLFQQVQNRKRMPVSRFGRGVSIRPKLRAKPWVAEIRVNGEHHYLGTFATREEAHAAYKAMATTHFGEFYAEPEGA